MTILGIVRKIPVIRRYSTKSNARAWARREVDWKKDYLSTAGHPHRGLITWMLKSVPFQSLWEVGVGGGANIARIVQDLNMKGTHKAMLGGSDVSASAIEFCKTAFKTDKGFAASLFHVEAGDNLMMSDKSVDVILTDMTLIYVGPLMIRKYLREFRRVARTYVVLVEFDSKSWWVRWKERLTGHHVHNYRKLMEKEGYFSIQVQPIPEQYFPGAESKPRAIITARP